MKAGLPIQGAEASIRLIALSRTLLPTASRALDELWEGPRESTGREKQCFCVEPRASDPAFPCEWLWERGGENVRTARENVLNSDGAHASAQRFLGGPYSSEDSALRARPSSSVHHLLYSIIEPVSLSP